MKSVPLTIEALGPLAFPERKPGLQFRTSLPYIPGAAIYGALGMVLGREWQGSPEEFAQLFRSIRCHNAYPALVGDNWSRPLPMTAVQPKGGKTADKLDEGHGDAPDKISRLYDDSLYERVCWEQQQPAALIYAPSDAVGRPWEAVKRTFYILEDPQGNSLQVGGDLDKLKVAAINKREVFQRVLTRVSINRRRGTAEDSRLYSPLVISEVMENRDKQLVPTRFLGSIAVPEDDEQVLGALHSITHIGGRQTTGIGAVEIAVQSTTSLQESVAALRKRIDAMSQRFQQYAQLYQELGGVEWKTERIFTINLLSDALLFEQGWLPTNELSGAMLQELSGIEARLLRAFTTTTTVGGWNVSWQRPKPTAVATQMGSLFVFQAVHGLSDADYQKLSQLEQDGIGERRAEGYGQVRVCDEFHLLPLEES